MIWLKACPRCGGDLFEDRDWYNRTVKCFQCGRTLTPAQERQLRMKSVMMAGKEGEVDSQETVLPRPRKRKKAA